MRYRDVHCGDRVYLRFRPALCGTVTRVGPEGFAITWDFPERKRYEPRSRFRYPWALGERFVIGVPPVSHEGLL